MVETKYGVISDVHQDPRIVPVAIDVLKSRGVEKLILNGDIGNSQDFIGYVIQSAGQSDLETYVQPGSHETIESFEPVITALSNKYPNIVNCAKNRKVENKDHHLVFLPGSDFTCGGEYSLKVSEDPSGLYQNGKGFVNLTNINDLRRDVTNPEKTIVICHVPRKFDGLETCVDIAYFAETPEGIIPGILVENQIRQQTGETDPRKIEEIAKSNSMILKKENRGNLDLKDIYEELGITKSVSGHFHESGHRANDRDNRHVKEGEAVSELFWNSGHLDVGQTGILTINNEKASYQNIRLQDYVN